MTDMEILIEQAAAWLDVRYPGWAEKIDTDHFHMSNEACCIGGQLGVDWHDLRSGFENDTGAWGAGVFAGYTAMWLEQIEQRVGVPA